MCGKYHLTTEDENISFREAIRQLMLEHPELPIQMDSVVPSQFAPVYTKGGLLPLRFGHKVSFSKQLLINARSETLASSRLFAPRLQVARVLVPAKGFYEWSPQKKPHLFGSPRGGLIQMAGLSFKVGEQNSIDSFVIITREARGTPAQVHPRMPLIFQSPELQQAWLHQDGLAENLLGMGEEDLVEISLAG